MKALYLLVSATALTFTIACGGADDRREVTPGYEDPAPAGQPGTPGAEGTTGALGAGGTVLSGCLDRNTRTGQFELAVDGDAGPVDGVQPAGSRLVLTTQVNVELNQHIGKRVTVEGSLGAGQPVSDAGTRTYGAGEGADPSQTRSRAGDSRMMNVTAVRTIGDTCEIEER
jgi:hypothetical protein